MDGETIFIDRPIELERDGALIKAHVRSGMRTITFVLTAHNFLASFANANGMVSDWKSGEVLQLERH
jgi:hypothetical protein